jgi:very-short-patch-repair endonuclease
MSENLRARLADLASRQHGVVAPFQCRSMASPAAVRHELESGRWDPICGPVRIVAGAPLSPRALAMARLLRSGPGGTVSHMSALALWDVIDHGLDPLHVTRIRHTNSTRPRTDGVVPHETRRMPPAHVTMHDGFAVVTPARALADAAASTPSPRLQRWLDAAWSMRLLTIADLHDVIVDLHRPGRRGIGVLKTLVDQRGNDYVAPASGLESRLGAVLRKAGMGPVRRQVYLGGRDWAGRVDFLVVGTPVVIEVQSDRYHASLTARADDEARTEALAAGGFWVVEVWESDVWHHPERVVEAVRAAVRTAQRAA